jgi:hypothetical protein
MKGRWRRRDSRAGWVPMGSGATCPGLVCRPQPDHTGWPVGLQILPGTVVRFTIFRLERSTGQTVRLRDGRRLGYAEWGDRGGWPLLYFHGWPGSRLEGRLGGEAPRAEGVRVIALDRPGMGLPDYQPGRTLADWPDDVLQLAAALGLERFAVLGFPAAGAPAGGQVPERGCGCPGRVRTLPAVTLSDTGVRENARTPAQ